MFHSTSGKWGSRYYASDCVTPFPRELLKKVLLRENELRFSQEVQAQYSVRMDNGNDYLYHIRDVTIQLQKQALIDIGVPENEIDFALKSLQSHRSHYSMDPEILSLSVYGRYDISQPSLRPTQYSPADQCMNVPLTYLNGKKTTVGQLISTGKKRTLVVASSLS